MKDSNKIKARIISPHSTIIQALRQMDEVCAKSLAISEEGKYIGFLTIGDLQRAIIKGLMLSTTIDKIIDPYKDFATNHDSIVDIRKRMLSYRAECMPVVDDNNNLVDIIFWDDVINERFVNCSSPFNLPVVIMAGGKGTRLRPLTNILPKPLIPISDKTIVEDIMDRFVDCGSSSFYISVNYKADFIRSYFSQLNNLSYHIEFFQEEKPLGTIGSLSLIKDKITSTFFVSNCDIIVDEDYSQILKYHKDNNNDLTLVSALKTISIPYGVVETTENGLLKQIDEKPDMSFQINTGMYVLEPQLLSEIPPEKIYHVTDLMNSIIQRGGKVGCFPVSDKSWVDIGNWNEYINKIK